MLPLFELSGPHGPATSRRSQAPNFFPHTPVLIPDWGAIYGFHPIPLPKRIPGVPLSFAAAFLKICTFVLAGQAAKGGFKNHL